MRMKHMLAVREEIGGRSLGGRVARRVFERGKEYHTGGRVGRWRYKKVEMPFFEATDPNGWILKSEKYFTVCRLGEEEKVHVPVVAMEGNASKWYRRRHRCSNSNQMVARSP